MAWALNSGVYCFLGLLGVMSGFWCLLVQNSSAPQYAFSSLAFALISKAEKLDEFSLGHVTKENYKVLDWEDFRRAGKPLIERGCIDGFLSVTEISPGNYRISLYETLEAMEYDWPRRSFGISSEIFREGLSLETGKKKYTLFHNKWVQIYGVFECFGRRANLPLADTIKCD